MIKIGDKVKFLNDVGGGVVTGFINKTTVNVEDQDGFEVPYPINQLVNLSEAERQEKEKSEEHPESIEKKEQKAVAGQKQGIKLAGKDSPDFYFCLVPDDPKNPLAGETTLWLVNDSNFTVLYQYAHHQDEKYKLVKFGSVLPNSSEVLESIDQNDLTDLPDFVFQILYFTEIEKDLHHLVVKKFKISPVKFYKEKSFQPNLFFNKNAMVLQITPNILTTEIDKLTDEDLKKVVEQKSQEKPVDKQVKKQIPEVVEVDLHINMMMDNAYGLSKLDMLQLQKERVESEMKSAIQSGVKKIIFIHGVGQGVLKQEIAKLLKSKFPRYQFHDASFREYGYGATMVILKKG